jgi:serine/threonine-protein kinase
MPLTPGEVIAAVNDALGVDGFAPSGAGGQKLVGPATLSGVPVMVKVVMLPSPDPEPVLERAMREVEILAEIDSERVVKVLSEAIGVGDGPDAVCWAEELLDGQDLGALLGLNWGAPAVAGLVRDVAEGLLPFHEREIVHRDLSPGNIRALSSGRFTVMDPGLARHLLKQSLTGIFQPGTAGFRSPEHVPSGRPIPASDIFCVGILAFVAATTVNEDGSPHVTAVGALWLDGSFWFQTGSGTRKGRNVARDSRCSIAVSILDADVVAEGEAARETDPATLTHLARAWADQGWPAELDETRTGITAPFNAPSQGPPPWNVYRIKPHSVTVTLGTEPGGLTRFRF